jgi:hypothetical protein
LVSDSLWEFSSREMCGEAFIKQGINGSIVFTASMASYRPNEVSSPLPFGLQAFMLTMYSAFLRHCMALPKPVCAI